MASSVASCSLSLIIFVVICLIWQIEAYRSSLNNKDSQRVLLRQKSLGLASLLDNSTLHQNSKLESALDNSNVLVDEEELLELQAYLEKYGYSEIAKSDEAMKMLDSSLQTPVNNQNKDFKLKIALELLQKTLDLPSTGHVTKTMLDITKNELRCGNKDFKPAGGSNQKAVGDLYDQQQDAELYSSSDFEWPNNYLSSRTKHQNDRLRQILLDSSSGKRQISYRVARYSKRMAKADLDSLIERAFDRWATDTKLLFIQIDEMSENQEAQIEIHFNDKRLYKLELFDSKVFRFNPIELAQTFTSNGVSEIHINENAFYEDQRRNSHPVVSPSSSIDSFSDTEYQHQSMSDRERPPSNEEYSSSNTNGGRSKQNNFDDYRKKTQERNKISEIGRSINDHESYVANNIPLRRKNLHTSSSDLNSDTQNDYHEVSTNNNEDKRLRNPAVKNTETHHQLVENLDDILDISNVDSEIQQSNGRSLRFRRWLSTTTQSPKLTNNNNLLSNNTTSPLMLKIYNFPKQEQNNMGYNNQTDNNIMGVSSSNFVNNPAIFGQISSKNSMIGSNTNTTTNIQQIANNKQQQQINQVPSQPTTPIGQLIAQYGPKVVAHITQNPHIIQKLLPLLQKLQQEPQLLQQVLQTLQSLNIDTEDIIRQVTNLAKSGAIDVPKLLEAVYSVSQNRDQYSNSTKTKETESMLASTLVDTNTAQHMNLLPVKASKLENTFINSNSNNYNQQNSNNTGSYDIATRFIMAQLNQGQQTPIARHHQAMIGNQYNSNAFSAKNVDLESLIAHEIGHALGMGHNLKRQNSIMHPYFYGGFKNNTIEDMEAVAAIYGRYGEQPMTNASNKRRSRNGDRSSNFNGDSNESVTGSKKNGRSGNQEKTSNSNNKDNDDQGWRNSRQTGNQWRNILKSMPEPMTMGKSGQQLYRTGAN